MGMNPLRSGGSLAYAITQHSVLSPADLYGTNSALINPGGITQGALGAPASSFGAGRVSPVPPTLRSSTAGVSNSPLANIPVLGQLFTGTSAGVQLLILAVLTFFALRFVVKEVE